LSKNRLPVWQESNSGFGNSNTAGEDVKAKIAIRKISASKTDSKLNIEAGLARADFFPAVPN
jgi:hypothetical protein